ncbi:hypothetical protein RBI94_17210 [Pseudomonas putida]|uniref:hypothetical protein n=1 Tax=Pseudomonas putida TaxID=303 RepID=UPI0013F4F768|nr:hypothetical protein [Pseudomonas putida]MDQ2485737.1 hypothetical protein [Pseudomonas putida]
MTDNPVSQIVKSADAAPVLPKKSTTSDVMHFYQNGHLASEVSPQGHRKILWTQEIPVAQIAQSKQVNLLSLDRANSVLGIQLEAVSLSPYGYLPPPRHQDTNPLQWAMARSVEPNGDFR